MNIKSRCLISLSNVTQNTMGLCDQRCHLTVILSLVFLLTSRKDPLILCVGPRRLRINPIYSQHSRGGGKGANNVHKFERFLRHGVTSVATIYGPVVFGKQPCVLLKETTDAQGNDDTLAIRVVGMSSSFLSDHSSTAGGNGVIHES